MDSLYTMNIKMEGAVWLHTVIFEGSPRKSTYSRRNVERIKI